MENSPKGLVGDFFKGEKGEKGKKKRGEKGGKRGRKVFSTGRRKRKEKSRKARVYSDLGQKIKKSVKESIPDGWENMIGRGERI